VTEIIEIDVRGLSCPLPVMETKKVIESSLAEVFQVLVDNETSRENVARFAKNLGCDVEVNEKGENTFQIDIRRVAPLKPTPEPIAVPEPAPQSKVVIYVGSATMGSGDDELGLKLMRGFLRTQIDCEPKPWRIIFINSGVKLTTVDDEAVEAVSLLVEHGVEALSCGTCLQHFGIEDKLRVGRVTNMYEVIETMNAAGKVISPD
jgi:selenium metabolism protein YedF